MRTVHALFFFALIGFSLAASAQDYRSELTTQLLMQDLRLKPGVRAPESSAQIISLNEKTDLVEVTLSPADLAPIRLLLRGPKGFYFSLNQRYPTLLLVSGFMTGRESVRLLGDIPDAVIAGFEYPFNTKDFMRDPGTVFQFVRQTPGQIALSTLWLQDQRWMQPWGLTVMGVSLGGIVLPSGIHIAQNLGVTVPRVIFTCSGANLTPVFEANLKDAMPAETRRPLVQLLNNLMSLHDPQIHLPALRSNFLVLRSDADQTIPAESTARLWDLLNGRKEEVVMRGPHINVDQPEVIKQAQDAIYDWLKRN